MEHFTPLESTLGGMLVGLASAAMLLFNGKIAGISGIAGGLLAGASKGDRLWRAMFVLGLLLAGGVYAALNAPAFAMTLDRSAGALVLAGLLVGFGTRLGNGCTSGHGVCGISRLSRRSVVATGTFMLFGFLTVYVTNHLLGGSL